MKTGTGILRGALIGLVLAAAGLWLGAHGSPAQPGADQPATITTTTAARATPSVAEPAWTAEGGVRFESTVVIVDGFDVDGSTAVLDYRLVALGSSQGFSFGGSQLPPVLPETWELVTTSGTIVDATSGPPRPSQVPTQEPQEGVADSIRFEGETDLDAVASVKVTAWRVAVPGEVVVELPGVDGASAQLYDGTVMKINAILEQRNGAIIGFELDRSFDPWRVALDQGFGPSTQFVGDGPGWQSAASTIGGLGLTGGATGFQLMWSEPTAPETVRVLARLVSWEPLDGTVTVWSET